MTPDGTGKQDEWERWGLRKGGRCDCHKQYRSPDSSSGIYIKAQPKQRFSCFPLHSFRLSFILLPPTSLHPPLLPPLHTCRPDYADEGLRRGPKKQIRSREPVIVTWLFHRGPLVSVRAFLSGCPPPAFAFPVISIMIWWSVSRMCPGTGLNVKGLSARYALKHNVQSTPAAVFAPQCQAKAGP